MNPSSASSITHQMLDLDQFSQWLGIEIVEVREGYCLAKMKLREEMINGLGVVHGGIAFSLADSAFAFACNNRNNLSLALDTSINFTKTLLPGDELVAEAKELHNGKSTGVYLVTLHNQNNMQVGLFKGTCFRTGKPVF